MLPKPVKLSVESGLAKSDNDFTGCSAADSRSVANAWT
jgi:hypothetical protein